LVILVEGLYALLEDGVQVLEAAGVFLEFLDKSWVVAFT